MTLCPPAASIPGGYHFPPENTLSHRIGLDIFPLFGSFFGNNLNPAAAFPGVPEKVALRWDASPGTFSGRDPGYVSERIQG